MNWLLNDLPRTEENGFQHVTTGETKDRVRLHENEIWVDTIFMAVLFSAKMGVKYDKADWREESLYQLLIHIKYLYDKKTNLLYHGWSFTDRDNFSEAFWCRGNSWFTVAVPEYLQLMGNYLDKGVYHYLTEALTGQVRTLCRFQAKDGLWHTLIDDPDSYTEVSGSAAMAAGMLKAVRLGILPEEPYFSAGMKTLHAVMDNIAEDGTVLEVSAGTPIGKTKENYKSIIKAPMAYGQALAMVLLTESLAHL